MCSLIWDAHHHRLENLNSEWIDLESFASAVHNKGCPLDNVWGFIDSTLRGMCKPSEYQELYFNSHKRKHGLKFQSIICPNRLIAHCTGPMEGRHHDAYVYFLSGINNGLANKVDQQGRQMAIFGDSAYALHRYLLKPFKGHNLSTEQEEFNHKASPVRQSVEWGFGKVISLFAFLDFAKNQKFLLQPLKEYYLVSTLLTNAHTYLYGSQTSDYFEVDPPHLLDYFA